MTYDELLNAKCWKDGCVGNPIAMLPNDDLFVCPNHIALPMSRNRVIPELADMYHGKEYGDYYREQIAIARKWKVSI